MDVETDECRVEKCRVERFSSRAFFFLFRDDAPRFPSLTFRSFPLLSCPPRRSLEGNAALSEAKTYALAEEFHISPREVLAVVEHLKMKAEAA